MTNHGRELKIEVNIRRKGKQHNLQKNKKSSGEGQNNIEESKKRDKEIDRQKTKKSIVRHSSYLII